MKQVRNKGLTADRGTTDSVIAHRTGLPFRRTQEAPMTRSAPRPGPLPHGTFSAPLGRRTFLRGIAGVGTAATLPAFLAACSGDDDDATQQKGDPNAPANLTFWTWATNIDK